MPTIQNILTGSGVSAPLLDPTEIAAYRQRFFRPRVRNGVLANSIYVPFGRRRARGWVLLTKADFDRVRADANGYATNLSLTIQASSSTAAMTLSGLSIVTAECVTSGLAGRDAAYLVEFTDARGVLASPWFQFPTVSYYNVLAPAYPGDFYASSLNAGVAWSWSGMVGNIWGQMPSLGTYTGLPSAPAGQPYNWNLNGVSCWDALADALYHIGMGVACDLTSAKPYSVAARGADDAAFTALAAASKLDENMQPIDVGAARAPGQVVVYFRKIYQYYGTEETIRRDSNQWATGAMYSCTVAAPAFFSGAPGTGFIWDDYPVFCDINGVPIDTVTPNAIAAERTQQYYDDIYSRTAGSMDQTYIGVVPFAAGSQVDGVRWYQDYSRGRGGWRTQVVRGRLDDIWPDVYGGAEADLFHMAAMDD